MSLPSELERFLLLLDTEQAQLMLKDLRNEDKRTPQLYAAINRMLARHEFTLKKFTVDEELLGDLASEVVAAMKHQEDEDGFGEYPLQ